MHTLTIEQLHTWIDLLCKKIGPETFNIKILLIGGRTPEQATLWMLPLAPHFPEKKLYTQGATVITFPHERFLPHAKTLNMLPSYIFYKKAVAAGCYDALLLNRNGAVTEGTRTNVLAFRKHTIISPPTIDILEGVTRANVLRVAKKNGFDIVEEPLPLAGIKAFDGLCLTSTSSKIMPIRKIDDIELKVPEAMRELMKKYEEFLEGVHGSRRTR